MTNKLSAWILCAAALLCLPAPGRAAQVQVELQTSSLQTSPAGPFSFAAQFAPGSGQLGNNSVTISAFDFVAGMPSPVLPQLIGGAAGTLFGTVTLVDSDSVNFFSQGFVPGSALRFQITMTSVQDDGGIADTLVLYITDSTGNPVPTEAGEFGDYFLFALATTDGVISTFAGDVSRAPVAGGDPINFPAPQASNAVPEPATPILLAALLGSMFSRRNRCRLRILSSPRSL